MNSFVLINASIPTTILAVFMSENVEKGTLGLPILASIAMNAIMMLVLWAQGRIWWCKSGDWAVYINQV